MILFKNDKKQEIFLIYRSDSPVWNLPGGGIEKGESAEETVVRETFEETNIDLLDRCRFLATMELMRSVQKPEMRILPFVVLLGYEQSIELNEELEGFVWISPDALVQHRGTIKFGFGEFPAYIVGSIVIWGLTYRILERFVNVFEPLS